MTTAKATKRQQQRLATTIIAIIFINLFICFTPQTCHTSTTHRVHRKYI